MTNYKVTSHHDGTRWRWTIEEVSGEGSSRPLIQFNSPQDAAETVAALSGASSHTSGRQPRRNHARGG